MDKKQTFTKEESNTLTTDGFAAYCHALRNSLTHVEAYEATERVHQMVHLTGKRKYADFDSYTRINRLKRNRTAELV